MSNTRKTREVHAGKFTRPKHLWSGHVRNRYGYAPTRQQQQTEASAMSRVMDSVRMRVGSRFALRTGKRGG